MNLGLEDKRALVLGSSSGIGRGIASALVAEGARVAISSRGGEKLERAFAELGAAARVAADLEEPGAGAAAVESAREALAGLDVLVTNCGGPPRGGFLDLDDAAWERSFRGVFMSAVDAIRAALPAMLEAGWGRVLLVTSSSGREAIAGLTLSNAYRPGLHGLVNSLSKEVTGAGVTVNAIVPGTIDTERIAELGAPRHAEGSTREEAASAGWNRTTIEAAIPAGRLGRAEEIGWLAAFLASERAGYISGQAIVCDGARMASI